MTYDVELADRIRSLVSGEPGLQERAMFGGLAFLLSGNMAIAASGEGGLLVRVDPEQSDELVKSGEAQPMVMRGRAMGGWLRVEAHAVTTEQQLQRWVNVGVGYAGSLPAKDKRKPD
jgi:TfoX/Sxy family transcriptional regulator of competence genes